MNARFGMLLGVNLAVAAVFMQGCKATKSGGETPPPPPQQQARQQPPPKTAAQHDIETSTYVETKAKPADVKPLPPPPQKGAKAAAVQGADKPADMQGADKPSAAQGADKPSAAQGAAKPVADAPAPEYIEYTVKRGDMLSRICAKHGIRQREVVKLNPGMNPDRLYAGKKIRLPASVAASADAAKSSSKGAKSAGKPAGKVDKIADLHPAPKSAAANVKAPATKKTAYTPYNGPTKEYVVKSGDQLGKIALNYGISVRALKELNGLQNNNLRIGQKLKVPAEKVKAETKAASAKDAPKTEPAKTDAPAAVDGAAAAAAPAAPAADAAPAAATEAEAAPAAAAAAPAADVAPAAVEAAPAAEEAPAAAPLTYTVKEGEDIVAIAINFGVSPSALLDINDLQTGSTVKAGQVLKLPPGAKLQ